MTVGRILRPHGVRGEVRMEILTGYPERLSLHRVFYLGPQAQPYPVESIRFHQGAALIKLAGCDNRNAAETLRGLLVQIPLEDAVPLEEGEYYYFQVVGLEVFTEAGECLGRVMEVIETGANDVYVVHGPRGELLVPAIGQVVQSIELAAGRMVITPLPGMLDESR
ncbi:MAG: ribosome maturation factor RimM [Caldilineales bacterium]|nr:ribosome maturation factor RimM [Caldilineales bacterium]